VVADYEESFFRTYFYHRTVTRVEKYSNAVVISIVPTCEQLCQPPVYLPAHSAATSSTSSRPWGAGICWKWPKLWRNCGRCCWT
jgi:hypothetical protein